MSPIEQFNVLYQTNRDAARHCLTLALDGAEKLVTLHLDAAQELLAEGGDQLKQMWSSFDSSEPAAAWPSLMERNVQGSMAMTRTYLETVTRLQTEFAHIVEWQAPAIGKTVVDALQQCTGITTPDRAHESGTGRRLSEISEHKARKAA